MPTGASETAPGTQPQQPPPQQPPPAGGAAGVGAGALAPPRETVAKVVSNLTVSSWPIGQVAGAADSAIGRVTSNVSPQLRHR